MLTQDGVEIRAIPAPTGGSRAFCDRMNAWAIKEGLPGMGYIMWREEGPIGDPETHGFIEDYLAGRKSHTDEDLIMLKLESEPGLKVIAVKILESIKAGDVAGATAEFKKNFFKHEGAGPLAKNIGPERTEAIRQQLGLKAGDSAFFLAGEPVDFLDVAAKARVVIGTELGISATDRFDFCWIVDFPMYEQDPETGALDFSHNPFSMPQGGMEALETQDPLDILGYQYDIVCNGVELSSGAVRNHKPDVMYKAFDIVGHDKAFVDANFGGMISAFKFGAPPHGGIAPGIDRMVMLLADAENIREVIMFPMNQRAEDLMMGAPSVPTNEALRDLGIRFLPKD
ncbi:MAG: aspartyl-tRNA synthetase [Paracoccaceae bacterium]|jgi:aspartyl-tRNA synthetase